MVLFSKLSTKTKIAAPIASLFLVLALLSKYKNSKHLLSKKTEDQKPHKIKVNKKFLKSLWKLIRMSIF